MQQGRRPIDDDRRDRSPGLQNNFYDMPTRDFKKPYGQSDGDGGGGPASDPLPPPSPPPPAPPPLTEESRSRSPGLQNNFMDAATSDFKKPYGQSSGAPTGIAQPFGQSGGAPTGAPPRPSQPPPTQAPRPIDDEERRTRSGGLPSFLDLPTREFARPFGLGGGGSSPADQPSRPSQPPMFGDYDGDRGLVDRRFETLDRPGYDDSFAARRFERDAAARRAQRGDYQRGGYRRFDGRLDSDGGSPSELRSWLTQQRNTAIGCLLFVLCNAAAKELTLHASPSAAANAAAGHALALAAFVAIQQAAFLPIGVWLRLDARGSGGYAAPFQPLNGVSFALLFAVPLARRHVLQAPPKPHAFWPVCPLF